VSNFTRNHLSFTFLINSGKSGWIVGSHQQIETQSSNQILLSKKLRTDSAGILSLFDFFNSSGNTNSGL
jgi:hypothetical protein